MDVMEGIGDYISLYKTNPLPPPPEPESSALLRSAARQLAEDLAIIGVGVVCAYVGQYVGIIVGVVGGAIIGVVIAHKLIKGRPPKVLESWTAEPFWNDDEVIETTVA